MLVLLHFETVSSKCYQSFSLSAYSMHLHAMLRQSIHCTKPLILLTLIFICIAIISSNLFYTNLQKIKRTAIGTTNQFRCKVLKMSHKKCSVEDLKVGKARYDSRRMLRIYDFHYTGSEWESLIRNYAICFATQTSVERIYWLPYILEKWTGPLSIAVHLTGDAEWLVLNLFMCYLSHCHASYRNQVALHLAVPSSIQRAFTVRDEMLSQWNVTELGEIYEKGQSCPDAKDYLKHLLKTFPTVDKESLKLKEVYPQNHMRNIARKACGTHWTYSADVDIIPRDEMADMLQEFYESRRDEPCDKCAFVVPTFELSEAAKYPRSKLEIIELFRKGIARPFHGRYFPPGHRATDYKKWTSTHLDDDKVTISHEILLAKGNTKKYEPFYVSPDDVPPFDERLLGYGFTRSSQFKAARMAGWNFTVLTPVFSIHWGLQNHKTVLSPKKDGVGEDVRGNQTQANGRVFQNILVELKLKKKFRLF